MARQAKFLLWYKRAGQRVLINADGDMLVRPCALSWPVHILLHQQRGCYSGTNTPGSPCCQEAMGLHGDVVRCTS